jgi:hypothetical protein
MCFDRKITGVISANPTSAARPPRVVSAADRASSVHATSTCAGPYAASFAARDALSAASWCAVGLTAEGRWVGLALPGVRSVYMEHTGCHQLNMF